MGKQIFVRPAARADIREAAAHYRSDSGLGIALAFTDQLQRLMVGMAGGHESGSPRIADAVALPGLRVWRVPRFPLLVIALEREDRFDLIRVLHAKRDLPQDFPF